MKGETESSIKVLFTTDYGSFKFLKGNRDLNSLKVKRIAESVSSGLNLFRYCPIMVNKEGFIIDGQHRFIVCKQLHLPVFYIVVQDFTLRQIAQMNQNASKWKDRDFVNCYTDTGNEHYKKLTAFVEKYQINLGIAVSLLQDGKVRGKHLDNLRDGLFKAEYEGYAESCMQQALQFQPFCEAYKSRNFLQAIETLMVGNKTVLPEIVEKLKQHKLQVKTKSSTKEYLTHIEDLYNHRNSIRRRIY